MAAIVNGRVERTRPCIRCGEEKPWSEFWAAVKWEDGSMRRPQSVCKACSRAAHRARAKARRQRARTDPEYGHAFYEQARRYRREHYQRRMASERVAMNRRLPIAPFRAWVEIQEQRLGPEEVSRWLGVHVRRIRTWRLEAAHITFGAADAALVSAGRPDLMYAFWPELRD